MKLQIKELITVLLIQLILTIPFYTTNVYATINKITVKGSDGISGYAREKDFLNFEVKAFIFNDKVTNDQVFLGNNIKFDKCVGSITNGSDCTLRFPSNGTQTFSPMAVPFTINLFNDNGTLDDSKTSTVIIDNLAPQLSLSISQNKFNSKQDVRIDYSISDTACNDPSCAGACSGIKDIEFFTSDGSFNQKVDILTSSCNFVSNISITSQTFIDGSVTVFAKARDNFNQASTNKSVTFTVDATPPIILGNSFEILRKSISISTFSLNIVDVDVKVNVSANDLDPNSVVADFSALNPALTAAQKATCTAFVGQSECKWSIQYNPKTAGAKTININASDTSGNTESVAISKLLNLDNQGPVVLTLSTTTTVGGIVYAKPTGNVVITSFDELTGLSQDEVFLHVGGAKLQASSCSKVIIWGCTWNNVDFTSSNTMSIQSDTIDILGNKVNKSLTVQVTVDGTAPVLNSLNLSPVGGVVPAFPNIFKVGDKIAVVANLTEANDVFAVADFSKFIQGASKEIGICNKIGLNEHICTWLTAPITSAVTDVIKFNFTDSAGNSLIFQQPLTTFGLQNATLPDFWSNTVSCSPKTIDRQLGPLINQRVYCTVNLIPKQTPLSTVFIGPARCTGDTSILQTVETFNAQAGSISPIIKFTLIKDDFKINNANLSCSLDIFSQVGAPPLVTKNPETEAAQINILFSNLPLGELSQEVQDKIDEAIEDAKGIWEWISWFNELIFYAKRICQIINAFYNAVATVYYIVYIVTGYEIVAQKDPFGIGLITLTPANIAGCKTETSLRVATQNTNSLLNKFCSFVNCKQTIFWGPEVQNWINNAPTGIISPGAYVGPKTEVVGEKWHEREVKVAGQTGPLNDYLRPISQYMDPNQNLIVATLFACLPGIVYGLDKYRQIKCLYADCLQNAVGKEGLPVTSCEDQKAFATCKYVTGELFAVFPWTAVFDHFTKLIKNALSNPFIALGAAISLGCSFTCPNPNAETRLWTWTACEGVKLFAQIGSIASDVKSIIDEGFTVRTDYCSRLDNEK